MAALDNHHVVRPREPAFLGLAQVIVVLTAIITWPMSATAQTTASDPAGSSPWDVTGLIGVLAGHPDGANLDRYGDNWYDAGHVGMVLGRYLTTHAKVEIELSTSGEGRQYVHRFVTIPNYPYPVPYSAEQLSRLRQVSGSMVWQFLENQWVHPFLQAGVAADFERVRTHIPAQIFYVGDARLPGSRVDIVGEQTDPPRTTTTARLLLGGGAKMYVTEQFFVRTDGRFAGNDKGHHWTFRVGLGLDF